MPQHWMIIKDFGSATYDVAYLDVTSNPAGPVTYTVYVNGQPANPVMVGMPNGSFATSPNLFGISGNRTALVEATTGGATSEAVARLYNNIGMAIPSDDDSIGNSFSFPVNNSSGVTILVGNTDPANNAVVTFGVGDPSAPPPATIPQLVVPPQSVGQQALPAFQQARVYLSSTTRVVVQVLAIGPAGLASFVVSPSGA